MTASLAASARDAVPSRCRGTDFAPAISPQSQADRRNESGGLAAARMRRGRHREGGLFARVEFRFAISLHDFDRELLIVKCRCPSMPPMPSSLAIEPGHRVLLSIPAIEPGAIVRTDDPWLRIRFCGFRFLPTSPVNSGPEPSPVVDGASAAEFSLSTYIRCPVITIRTRGITYRASP